MATITSKGLINNFRLKVLTPKGIVFDDNVTMFETTTFSGRIGICPKQTPLVALVKPNLSVVHQGEEKIPYVMISGTINANQTSITVFTDCFIKKCATSVGDVQVNIEKLEHLLATSDDRDLKASVTKLLDIEKLKWAFLQN